MTKEQVHFLLFLVLWLSDIIFCISLMYFTTNMYIVLVVTVQMHASTCIVAWFIVSLCCISLYSSVPHLTSHP